MYHYRSWTGDFLHNLKAKKEKVLVGKLINAFISQEIYYSEKTPISWFQYSRDIFHRKTIGIAFVSYTLLHHLYSSWRLKKYKSQYVIFCSKICFTSIVTTMLSKWLLYIVWTKIVLCIIYQIGKYGSYSFWCLRYIENEMKNSLAPSMYFLRVKIRTVTPAQHFVLQ